jgi:gliding motility-associated-like protein
MNQILVLKINNFRKKLLTSFLLVSFSVFQMYAEDVVAPPVPNISGNQGIVGNVVSVCYGRFLTLTATPTENGGSIRWYDSNQAVLNQAPATAIFNSNSFLPTFLPAGEYTYFVAQEVGGQSSSLLQIKLNILAAPSISWVTGDFYPAANSMQTYAVTDVAGATYSWSSSIGQISSTGNSININVGPALQQGNHFISVTATKNGCTSSSLGSSIQVGVSRPAILTTQEIALIPDINTSNNSVSYCQGSTIPTGNLISLGNNQTMAWSFSNNESTGGGANSYFPPNSFFLNSNIAGPTTIYVYRRIGNSFSLPTEVTYNILATPAQPSFAGNPSTVVNLDQQLTYEINPVANATRYVWSLPTNWLGSSTTTSISATVKGSGGNIVVTPYNATCPGVAKSLSIAVPGVLNPATVTNGTITFGGTANLADRATGLQGATLTFATLNNGTYTNTSSNTIADLAVGTYTYYVKQTLGIDASGWEPFTITVKPTKPDITGNANISGTTVSYCSDLNNTTTYSLTANPMAGGMLKWYDTSIGGVALNQAPSFTITNVTLTTSSTYYVSQIVNGIEGDRQIITLVINQTPTIGAVSVSGNNTNFTSNTNYSFTVLPTNISAQNGSSFIWNLPDEWKGRDGGGNYVVTSPVTTYTNALFARSGTKAGRIRVYADFSGCLSTEQTILIGPSAPSILIDGSVASSTLQVCTGSTAKTLSASGAPNATFNWYTVPTGGTASAQAPVLSTATAGTTTYYVAQVTNGVEGERASLIYEVKATPSQPGTITGEARPLYNSITTYSVSEVSGAASYTWTLPSGWSGTSSTNTINATIGSELGTITVKSNTAFCSSEPKSLTISKITAAMSAMSNLTKTFGDANFTIVAPSSISNGAITYSSSNVNVATIAGNVITIVGAGSATITATQAETSSFVSSGTTSFVLTVNKALPQLISFSDINKTFGDAGFNLGAPSSPSNGAVTYTSSNLNVATISGNSVTIVGAGTSTITANQAATSDYLASSTTAIITVAKKATVISDFTSMTKVFGASPFTITAPSSLNTSPFSYASSNTNVATVSGNTVTIIGAGESTITVNQASDANYLQGSNTTSLIVSKQTATLSSMVDLNKTTSDDPIDLIFPTSLSDGEITFTSSNTDVATVSGRRLRFISPGTVTITATQAATTNYIGSTSAFTLIVIIGDTDGDGVPDTIENTDRTNPLDPCSYVLASRTLATSLAWRALDCDGDGTPNGTDIQPTDFCVGGVRGVVPTFGTEQYNLYFKNSDCDGDGISNFMECNLSNFLLDTDGDGVPNFLDGDSDNDGIPDNVERNVDSDGDKTADYQDLDSDNDGIGDTFEKGANGFKPADTDKDGRPDYLDLDSDGDGLLDAWELLDVYAPGQDKDSNGIADVNGAFVDKNGNGWLDILENYRPTDTDKDGKPDYLDLDSDNDNISDTIEGTKDADNDRRVNFRDADSDGDGIGDIVEGQTDTDKDGVANYLDLDSDGDGILDSLEGVNRCPTCKEGVDSAPDGWEDSSQFPASGKWVIDTDKDGTPDYQDLDSDNDGIPDAVEAGATPSSPVDTDKDGVYDFRDLDSDNDGITDALEAGKNPVTPVDTDKDGTPDFQELDSDNDGIPDAVEAGKDPANPVDTDKDGTPDYQDLDSDNDGIPDAVEAGKNPTTPVDTDKDGTPDYQDLDSDNDGIPDAVEAGKNPTTPVDTDKDGTPDFQELDSDNDGIPDAVEAGKNPATPVDTDKDGAPDYQDLDSDNDGIPDAVEAGKNPATPVDTDKDGAPDYQDLDSDNDGIPDAIEAGKDPSIPVDTDKDGTPDYQDLDSDNDGISDKIEAGADAKNPLDTDKDGIYDFRELDSDNDGLADKLEAGSNPNNPVDTDGDGLPDYRDLESDGDGIPDKIEAGANPASPLDTDGDGTFDFRDLDSDGDGLSDRTEAGANPSAPVDTDGDGKPDFQDIDSDGDGLLDRLEDDVNFGALPDCDRDGIPNRIDKDVCETYLTQGFSPNGDGVNDTFVIPGLVGMGNNKLTVFNRWGNIVFEADNYKNDWGGKTNNAFDPLASDGLLPDGVYYYVIDFNGSRPAMSNYLFINRLAK